MLTCTETLHTPINKHDSARCASIQAECLLYLPVFSAEEESCILPAIKKVKKILNFVPMR